MALNKTLLPRCSREKMERGAQGCAKPRAVGWCSLPSLPGRLHPQQLPTDPRPCAVTQFALSILFCFIFQGAGPVSPVRAARAQAGGGWRTSVWSSSGRAGAGLGCGVLIKGIRCVPLASVGITSVP